MIRDHNPQSEFIRSGDYQKTILVQGELENFHSLERAINEHEIHTVFHLGAQTIVSTALRSPLSTFEANIRGTYHLLEACRKFPTLVKAVIIASSDKAYGDSDVLPYTEEMPLQGKHPYDVSKSCTDLLASTYSYTYQVPIAIVRSGNIYGGGDLNWSRLIPGTIRSFLENTAPIIRSDGTLTRDYLFVDDVVAAYLLIAEHMDREGIRGSSLNLGSNHPYSTLDIVKILQILMGKEDLPPKILNSVCIEIKNQSLSFLKIKNLLGWQPHHALEEGLKQTISWYTRYLQAGKTPSPQSSVRA